MKNQPSIWARIFGKRELDPEGYLWLAFNGKLWRRSVFSSIWDRWDE